MTNQEAIEMLTAKVECIRRDASGIDVDCNLSNCDECDLCYKQGTMGDQMEALCVAISALKKQEETRTLAKVLDGCPLPHPCDKLWSTEGWCKEHCKSQEPDAECWLKYAEVTAREAAEPENTDYCVYCNEDVDGYVKPIEKNSHAFIRFGMFGWELDLSAKGWHGSAKIKYCPMCGRKLKNDK